MISRRVANYMNKMPEESRYLRGMRAWVGFKQTKFEYERDARLKWRIKIHFKNVAETRLQWYFISANSR